MFDDDDAQIGRVLTRREVLVLMGGAAGAAFLAACAQGATASLAPTTLGTGTPIAAAPTALGSAAPTAAVSAAASAVASLPSCIVRPALTEGPYFVDEKLDRADVRSDPTSGAVSAGVPLSLGFLVSKISGTACTPFGGAVVDIWHCNAQGVYSDVSGNNEKFLRGYQVTDASGGARFTTIYPGWYQGRAVHVHFKIRDSLSASPGLEFTSQFFFDDALSAQVYAKEPYASKGLPDTTNARDGIYQAGGSQLLLAVTPEGDGYTTTFDIGLQVA